MRDILKKRITEPMKAKKDTKFVKEFISIKSDKHKTKNINALLFYVMYSLNFDSGYLFSKLSM